MAANENGSLLFVDYLFDVFSNKSRVVLPRSNPFDEYDEYKFRERFRLSKATVALVLTEVSSRVKLRRLYTVSACLVACLFQATRSQIGTN